MLDPAVQRLLDTVFKAAPPAAPDVKLLRTAAEVMPTLLGGDPVPLAAIDDVEVPDAGRRLRVRVYRPAAGGPLPLALFAHGGGWVTGSLDSHDRMCRHLAHAIGALIVAVDYRCAPEHAYPAALDDVEAAWEWVHGQARAIGADATRLAVAGDSSGGNLAAALALRLRARGAAQPRLQLLLYPALDAACVRPAYREYATGFNLSAAQMRWFWDVYRAGAAIDDPQLAPLAAADVAGLAPAVIAVAECDVLRDDGLDYASRLEAAGVPVRLVRCRGMIHGFLRWTGAVPAARSWIDAIAAAARATLAADV